MTKTETNRAGKILKQAILERRDIVWLSRNIGKTIAETSRLLHTQARKHPLFKTVCKSLNWPLNVNSGHIYTGSFNTPETEIIQESQESIYLRQQIDDLIDRTSKEYPRIVVKSVMGDGFYGYVITHPYTKMRAIRAAKIKRLKYLYKKSLEKVEIGGSIVHGERLGILKAGDHVFVKPIRGKNYSELFQSLPITEFKVVMGTIKGGKFEKVTEIWMSKYQIELNIHEVLRANKCTRLKPNPKKRIRYIPGKWLGSVNNRSLVSVNSNWK